MKLTKKQKEFIENYGRNYLLGGNTKIGEIYGIMQKENEKLHSIIKEVREFIKEMPNNEYIGYWKKEIFEILDKVEKENDIEFDVLKALNTDLDDDVEMG